MNALRVKRGASMVRKMVRQSRWLKMRLMASKAWVKENGEIRIGSDYLLRRKAAGEIKEIT